MGPLHAPVNRMADLSDFKDILFQKQSDIEPGRRKTQEKASRLTRAQKRAMGNGTLPLRAALHPPRTVDHNKKTGKEDSALGKYWAAFDCAALEDFGN